QAGANVNGADDITVFGLGDNGCGRSFADPVPLFFAVLGQIDGSQRIDGGAASEVSFAGLEADQHRSFRRGIAEPVIRLGAGDINIIGSAFAQALLNESELFALERSSSLLVIAVLGVVDRVAPERTAAAH